MSRTERAVIVWKPQPRQLEFMRRPEPEALYGGAVQALQPGGGLCLPHDVLPPFVRCPGLCTQDITRPLCPTVCTFAGPLGIFVQALSK